MPFLQASSAVISVFFLLTILSSFLVSCDDSAENALNRQKSLSFSHSLQLPLTRLKPYPKGRWRLAENKLDKVVVRLSHIFVAYKNTRARNLSLWSDWRPYNIVERSREDAYRIANEVYQKLRSSPDSFSFLARAYSDDLSTYNYGGSLGNVSASNLPSTFLDALSVLKNGEVSKIVESSIGFHIIKRLSVLRSKKVSAQRLVVSYKTGTELPFGYLPSRKSKYLLNRSNAEKKAIRLAGIAKKNPEKFDKLVMNNSDNEDRKRMGDIGVLDSDNPGVMGREIEKIYNKKPGETTDIIDSRDGFQIFRRSVLYERTVYAAKVISIYFDRPDMKFRAGRNRKEAKTIADNIVQVLIKNPGDFDKYQKEYGGYTKVQWEKGSSDVYLDVGIEKLTINGISQSAVESNLGYHVIKRLVPTDKVEMSSQVLYDIPNPDRPDINSLISTTKGKALSIIMKTMIGRTISIFDDSSEKRSAYINAINVLSDVFEKTDDQEIERKLAARRNFIKEVKKILSTEEYERFEKVINDYIVEILMNQED